MPTFSKCDSRCCVHFAAKPWAHYVSAYVDPIKVGQIIAWLAATKWPSGPLGVGCYELRVKRWWMHRDPQWGHKSLHCSWKTIFPGYAKHLSAGGRDGEGENRDTFKLTNDARASVETQIRNQIHIQRCLRCSWWWGWWWAGPNCSVMPAQEGAAVGGAPGGRGMSLGGIVQNTERKHWLKLKNSWNVKRKCS